MEKALNKGILVVRGLLVRLRHSSTTLLPLATYIWQYMSFERARQGGSFEVLKGKIGHTTVMSE